MTAVPPIRRKRDTHQEQVAWRQRRAEQLSQLLPKRVYLPIDAEIYLVFTTKPKEWWRHMQIRYIPFGQHERVQGRLQAWLLVCSRSQEDVAALLLRSGQGSSDDVPHCNARDVALGLSFSLQADELSGRQPGNHAAQDLAMAVAAGCFEPLGRASPEASVPKSVASARQRAATEMLRRARSH